MYLLGSKINVLKCVSKFGGGERRKCNQIKGDVLAHMYSAHKIALTSLATLQVIFKCSLNLKYYIDKKIILEIAFN